MQHQFFPAVIHNNDVIMNAIGSQITSLIIVYPTVYSGADQRKHERSASLAFVRGLFPTQTASNEENVSIWWRHHGGGVSWSYLWLHNCMTPCITIDTANLTRRLAKIRNIMLMTLVPYSKLKRYYIVFRLSYLEITQPCLRIWWTRQGWQGKIKRVYGGFIY